MFNFANPPSLIESQGQLLPNAHVTSTDEVSVACIAGSRRLL